MWISFEKRYGDKEGIEEVIVGKRRFQYEEELKKNPSNYDVWFDYIRLEGKRTMKTKENDQIFIFSTVTSFGQNPTEISIELAKFTNEQFLRFLL
jgi:hypothetical protein